MVDPADIKKIYGGMSDPELVHFAKSEGVSLTATAFQILKSEFLLRNINSDILLRIEDGSYLEEQASLKRIIKMVPDQLSTTVLAMAINEKRDGKSDETIVFHLMEQGLEEDRARLIIGELRPQANVRMKIAKAFMLTAVFIICAGLALKLISPQKNFVTFLDIASTCTIIFGVFRFLKGYFDYNKHKTVLQNLNNPDQDIEIKSIGG